MRMRMLNRVVSRIYDEALRPLGREGQPNEHPRRHWEARNGSHRQSSAKSCTLMSQHSAATWSECGPGVWLEVIPDEDRRARCKSRGKDVHNEPARREVRSEARRHPPFWSYCF